MPGKYKRRSTALTWDEPSSNKRFSNWLLTDREGVGEAELAEMATWSSV